MSANRKGLKRPRLDNEAIPLEKRSDKQLRSICLEHDIEPHSERAIMIARLQAHEQKKPVMTKALVTPIHAPPPPPVPDTFHQQAPIYARGELQLLGLPHEVIRDNVMYHLDDLDLFSMLYVCKYVLYDALVVLRHRAHKLLGAAATPLALHTVHAIVQTWNTETGIPVFVWKYRFSVENWPLNWTNKQKAISIVHSTIDLHGSIEAFIQDIRRRHIVDICREDDKKALENARIIKATQCNELLEKLGYTRYLFTNSGQVTHHYWFISHNISRNHASHVRKLFTDFVFYHKPRQLKTLEKYLLKRMSPYISNALRWAHCTLFQMPHELPTRHCVQQTISDLCKTMFYDQSAGTPAQIKALVQCILHYGAELNKWVLVLFYKSRNYDKEEPVLVWQNTELSQLYAEETLRPYNRFSLNNFMYTLENLIQQLDDNNTFFHLVHVM